MLRGTVYEAFEEMERLRREEGRVLVHPFDDADVVAGQGTLGLEVLEDLPDVDAIVVPVGGGGLISGVAAAAKGRRPEVAVVSGGNIDLSRLSELLG